MMVKCFLGLGSNLGDKENNLLNAIRLIELKIGRVIRRSKIISSAPWGFDSENSFLNMVILLETNYLPLDVLHLSQQIEKELGRTSKTTNDYTDRLIDIDILLYDDLEVDLPELKIPHPLMKKRDFVMLPLREIIDPLADSSILRMKFFE